MKNDVVLELVSKFNY